MNHNDNDAEATALRELLGALAERAYRFVTPTPASHARVLARPDRRVARGLADVFGWSLPFPASLLDQPLLSALREGKLVDAVPGDLLRATVRVSSLSGDLYVHSAYPTEAEDSVFFGPDSYRFADFIAAEVSQLGAIGRVIDIGTGSGVGAIVAGKRFPEAEIIATDVNDRALRYAEANGDAAGVKLTLACGDLLDPVSGKADLILANPPYIIDAAGRAYRDGGGLHGADVALQMADAALPRLNPGGRFLLYSGSAIVRGEDRLHQELQKRADSAGLPMRYREIDPDVFGEELSKPPYHDVDRIAVIGAVIG